MARITFKGAQADLRALGVTLNRTAVPGEFRVALAGVRPSQGGGSYYTEDLEDAVATGRDMSRRFAVHHPVREPRPAPAL